jgi:hypothetical protein
MAAYSLYEPRELLRVAAQIISAKESTSRTYTALMHGRSLLVRCDFPGIVRVFDANTGEPLATSAPGRPDTPADAAPGTR